MYTGKSLSQKYFDIKIMKKYLLNDEIFQRINSENKFFVSITSKDVENFSTNDKSFIVYDLNVTNK